MTVKQIPRLLGLGVVILIALALVYAFSHYVDVIALIKAVGYIGLFAIIFAESGLFIGFFLPGDSLLFAAGILASQGVLDIIWLVPICFLAALAGDSFGYWFGYKVGPALFKREDSLVFKKDHLQKAQSFYEKHGAKTIVLARFMPIVRTFAPIVAGIARMRYSTFVTYNIVGAVVWGACLPLLGYYLGNVVPDIERYLIPGILLIIFLSVLPPIIHVFKDPTERKKLLRWFVHGS